MARHERQEPVPALVGPASDTHCVAHGCPARASIFDTVSGPPRNGVCRYHHAVEPRRWPEVTHVLNTTQSRFETYERLRPMGANFEHLLAEQSREDAQQEWDAMSIADRARTAEKARADLPAALAKFGRQPMSRDWARRILLAFINDRGFYPGAANMTPLQFDFACAAFSLTSEDRNTLNEFRKLAELDRANGSIPKFKLADLGIDFGNDGD